MFIVLWQTDQCFHAVENGHYFNAMANLRSIFSALVGCNQLISMVIRKYGYLHNNMGRKSSTLMRKSDFVDWKHCHGCPVACDVRTGHFSARQYSITNL